MSSTQIPRKVALLGAESTGKTSLARELATYYRTHWVSEYLREFVAIQGRTPSADEQIHIARTQLEREAACFEALTSRQKYLFCDTTPLMTWLYSQHYFGVEDGAIMQLVKDHPYALTLVCAPDIPWVADGLQRESDTVRQHIHQRLITTLEALALPYHTINGR